MRTFKKIVLLAFISALFTTCKKEQLPPNSIIGQPLFSFTGTIGGNNNVSWQAGVNNYYMYSTYSQDSVTGVYSFIGTLQPANSLNNSIQIIINDYRVSIRNASISPAHIDTSLSQPVYFYNKGVPTVDSSYSITFTPHVYHGNPISYTYTFGDHTANLVMTSGTPVTHTYTSLENYVTNLTVDFSSPCGNMTMSNPFNLNRSSPLIIDSVYDSLNTKVGNNVPIVLKTNVSGGSPPYSFKWYFGDGDSATSTTPSSPPHNYLDSLQSQNTYSATLVVTDHISNTAVYNYIVQDSGVSCRFDYSTSSPTLNYKTNSNFLSDITIIYTNGSGVQYTSKSPIQSGSSTFQINSVSSYQNNNNNYPTIMLKVTFSCLVYPKSGSAINVTGTATIAVAYH